MKRIICIAQALLLVVSMLACEKQPANGDDTTTAANTTGITTASTQATDAGHTFGSWTTTVQATCHQEGTQVRKCADCNYTESRTIAKTDHQLDSLNICKTCRYVDIDPNQNVVELGVICNKWIGAGHVGNYAWDIKVWDGKVYRGYGCYDDNTGPIRVLAYNIATQTWDITGVVDDEAIHSFTEIDGKLYTPGIDPKKDWSLGNYYVLGEKNWDEMRNIPNGIHNFKMVESNGLIFAGLGSQKKGQTVAVSKDGGKTFSYVPLYKDGSLMDLSSYKSSRTYDFIKHNGDVYALVRFALNLGGLYNLFRYEDGKMVYVENGYKLSQGASISRNYIGGNFDFNGTCYVTAGSLYAITDFSDPNNYPVIPMPNKAQVADAFVRDGVIYVLTTSQNRNPSTHFVESYKTVIYKSTTGQAGSFEEVLSFDYVSSAICFDWDGTYFYIGTGQSAEKAKTGMILRVKPA